MARQYSNVNGLDQAVSGFMDARKQKQDELYRQATQQMAAQEAALLKMGGYMKPTAPQDGYSSGFEENQANVGRDQGPMEALAPQFFKKVLNPAKPEQPAEAWDISPSGKRFKIFPDSPQATQQPEPQRVPQSSPAPLLKNKEAIKLDPLAAQADKVIYNESDKKFVGQKPDGTLQYAAPAAKSEVSGLPGVALEGTPGVPAQPEQANNFNPSPMMRAKIQERITSQASKDTDPEIPVNSLPPNLRDKLGIPQDFQGSIRSSILKEMIQGSYKEQPKPAAVISPDIVDAIKSIESGDPLSSVARSLQDKRRGAGFSKQELDALESAESRRTAKSNFKSTQDFKVKESNRLSPNEVLKVEDGYAAYKSANELKDAMVNSMSLFGPLKGRAGALNPYDENAQSLNSAIYAAKQSIGKFLEGGVLRAEDEKKYEKMLPSISDSPSVAQTKLELIYKKLADKAAGYKTSLGRSGYDVSAFDELQKTMIPPVFNKKGKKETSVSGKAGQLDKFIEGIVGGDKSKEQISHAPSPYSDEKSRSEVLLEKYKKQVGEGPAYQRKKAQVDAFLKDKYGKGLSE